MPIRSFIALCASLLLHVSLAAAPVNILTNPGFESGTTAGWSVYNGGTLQAVTTSPQSGAYAGRSTNRTHSEHGLQQNVLATAVPGKCYIGSTWVRTSRSTPVAVKMCVQQTDGRGTKYYTLKQINVANAWTHLSGLFYFDVNGPLTGLNVYINGAPSGADIFVDDVSFAEVDTGAIENLLQNPDFENGATAWFAHGPATVAASSAAHTDMGAASVSNRTVSWHGIEQSVFGKTEDGRMYYGAGWVKTDSATTQPVSLTVEVIDSEGSRFFPMASGTASNSGWTWLSGTMTMPATNGLTDVKFFLDGPPGGVAMAVDNCYFAPVTGLRRAAAAFPSLRLGSVGEVSHWAQSPEYRAAVSGHFHLNSTENALKFDSTQPEQGVWTFAKANAIIDLGIKRGGTSRGHTLVWHYSLPNWVVPGSSTPAQMQSILWNHVDTTAAAFRNRLLCWDVVNEAFNINDGWQRDSAWFNQPGIGYSAEGDRYIRESFQRARAADPNVQIFYNDFNIETRNHKSDSVHWMLWNARNQGNPVNGIGFQSHFGSLPDLASVRSNFNRFQELGIDLHVTELDIHMPVDANGYASEYDLNVQGNRYFDYFSAILGYDRLKVIQTWGLYDGKSWVPSWVPGYGQALLFDFNFNRKPAYWGAWNALAGQAEKLPVLATSSGDSTTIVWEPDIQLSANLARRLQANEAGDSMTLGFHVPFPGQWYVQFGLMKHSGGGIYQPSFAPPGSNTFTDLETPRDTYSSYNTSALSDLYVVNFPTAGDWQYKATVTGRNAASSDYDVTVDYIRLTPITCSPVVSAVPDQTLAVNTSMPPRLAIAEDDFAQGTLQFTAASSNPALLPNSAIALEGASPYYTVAATPAADQLGTATVTLTANDGAQTGTETFLLTVTGTPLQTWRFDYFGTTADTGQAADLADSDNDGLPNLLEYAFNTSPIAPSTLPIAIATVGNALELTYPRDTSKLTELTYIVEWSDTLDAGSWSMDEVIEVVKSTNGTVQTMKATIPLPPGHTKRFMRVKVTRL